MRSGPAVLLLLACARTLHPPAPAVAPENLLDLARARSVPPTLQARVALQVVAGGTAAGTGGVIVTDRPGRGHVAALGPLGGPVATVSTDGVGVAVDLPRSGEHLVAADAAALLAGVSGGLLGPDDLVAVLLGDLPLDGREPASLRRASDDAADVVLRDPAAPEWSVDARIARDGTPRELTVERGRRTVLSLQWEPFEVVTVDAVSWLAPTRLLLAAPDVGLQVDVRYKSWKVPDPVPPVFSLATPPGAVEEDLEGALRRVGLSALLAGAVSLEAPPAP